MCTCECGRRVERRGSRLTSRIPLLAPPRHSSRSPLGPGRSPAPAGGLVPPGQVPFGGGRGRALGPGGAGRGGAPSTVSGTSAAWKIPSPGERSPRSPQPSSRGGKEGGAGRGGGGRRDPVLLPPRAPARPRSPGQRRRRRRRSHPGPGGPGGAAGTGERAGRPGGRPPPPPPRATRASRAGAAAELVEPVRRAPHGPRRTVRHLPQVPTGPPHPGRRGLGSLLRGGRGHLLAGARRRALTRGPNPIMNSLPARTPDSRARAPSAPTPVPKPVLQVPGRWRQHLQPRRRCRSLCGAPRRAGRGRGPWASPWRSQPPQQSPRGLGRSWAATASRCPTTRTSAASDPNVRPRPVGT